MNPILIKPKGNGQCQVVLRGRPWRDLGPGESTPRVIGTLREEVLEAFRDNALGREMLLIEGMGSPVEMNLKEKDVSNMWLAKATRSPVLLVGDIEKGGVFAGIYGTYLLMDEEERDLLKGFVINRFRGDASILGKGIEELESRMDMPCLGVLPLVRFSAPAEDSLDMTRRPAGATGSGDMRQRWMLELDRLLEKWKGAWDLEKVSRLV